MARRRHEPTERQRIEAEAFAKVGVPHHDIAVLLGITTKTLLKYYARELELGKARANAEMGKTLYAMGTVDKNVAAVIFWMKAQAGWREKHEIVGKNDGPIEHQHVVTQHKDPRGQLEKTTDPNEAMQLYSELVSGDEEATVIVPTGTPTVN